jgi:hypothetical protein
MLTQRPDSQISSNQWHALLITPSIKCENPLKFVTTCNKTKTKHTEGKIRPFVVSRITNKVATKQLLCSISANKVHNVQPYWLHSQPLTTARLHAQRWALDVGWGGGNQEEQKERGCYIGCPWYGILNPKIPPLQPPYATNGSNEIDPRPSESHTAIRKNKSIRFLPGRKSICLPELNPISLDETV